MLHPPPFQVQSPSSRANPRPCEHAEVYVAPAFRRAGARIYSVGLKADATLIERLEFNVRGAVVIAHPESDRRCGIVDEHSSNIRGPREQIVGHLTRLRIEPRHK